MMNVVINENADYFLHEFRIIVNFINLKIILFENSLFHFISSIINAYFFLFSDENIDSYLFISRFLPCIKKLFSKIDFNKINSICFISQAVLICSLLRSEQMNSTAASLSPHITSRRKM